MPKKPSITRTVIACGLASLCLVSSANMTLSAGERFACYIDSDCLASAAMQSAAAVDQGDLLNVTESLVRAGRFNDARAMAARLDRKGLQGAEWERASDDIAIGAIAARSWAAPNEVADLAPLNARLAAHPGSGPGLTDYLYLTADRILDRSSATATEAGVAKLFKARALHRGSNATLAAILDSQWPHATAQLPANRQGGSWRNLAAVWLLLGDRNAARQSLDHAERTGLVSSRGTQLIGDMTAPVWREMGDLDRSLRNAEHAEGGPGAASLKLDVARAYLDAGQVRRALDVTTSALADAHQDPHWPWFTHLLRTAVDLRVAAGDVQGARAVAEEIEAYRFQVGEPGRLLAAAQAFNDIGDHARAGALLTSALAPVTLDRKAAGVGTSPGHFPGANTYFGGSLLWMIAVELYRSGRLDDFDEAVNQLEPGYQRNAWVELCAISRRGGKYRPSDDSCAEHAGGAALRDMAVDAINRHTTADADRYLSRLIAVTGEGHAAETVELALDAARLALVRESKDQVEIALVAAARAADGLTDPGVRVRELLRVAALRHELAGLTEDA